MADSKLVDLTAVTALEAADVLYVVDDPGGTPLSRKVTVANLHLSINASTPDANVTGALGVLDVVTMSSMTADRDYTLPTTAAVGDRCGVAVVDGDDTYELLIKSGAAGDKINNVDHSTNEWSRLFIAGEKVVFVCIDAAGPHWLVENDGRIACKTRITRTASDGDLATNTDTKVLFDNAAYDIGDLADVATNKRIDIRRNGKYYVRGAVRITSVDSAKFAETRIYVNGAVSRYDDAMYSSLNGVVGGSSCEDVFDLSAGDYLEVWSQTSSTGTNIWQVGGDGFNPRLTISEIL